MIPLTCTGQQCSVDNLPFFEDLREPGVSGNDIYGSPLGPFHMRNSSVYARTASVRVCSWNCSCPICSRSAIIEIELDLALGTAKIENILR